MSQTYEQWAAKVGLRGERAEADTLRVALQDMQRDNARLAAKLRDAIPRRRIHEVLARHSVADHPMAHAMISELLAP